jgi:hypothetical protein
MARGAQYPMTGSPYKNALKHGLYARRLTKEEVQQLGAVPILNIDGEISYQRVMINRLGQILENNGLAAGSTGALSPDTRSTLKLLNETMSKLLAYLRLHNMLKGDLSEYREEIERGKMIGRERRHVFDYFKPPETAHGMEGDGPAPVAMQGGGKPAKARRKKAGKTGAAVGTKAERHD